MAARQGTAPEDAVSVPHQNRFIINRQGLLVLHEKLQAEIDQTQGRVFLHPLADLGGQWQYLDPETIG